MNFNYKFTDLARGKSGYDLLVGIEGDLVVTIDGATIFSEEGILLAELALKLYKWLRRGRRGAREDFYYASMDFEDEPLLNFSRSSSSDEIIVDSVWAKTPPIVVNQIEVLRSAEEFVECIRRDLKELADVNFDAMYDAMIEEG